MISFANENAVIHTAPTWTRLKVENNIPIVAKWLQVNKLTINLDETCYLPFNSYNSGVPNLGPLNIGLGLPNT